MGRCRQALAFGIGLIACCLLVIGFLVLHQLSRLAVDEELVSRTQAVIGSLEPLQVLVRDAEINQRHYLITGADTDLATFANTSVRLDDRLGDLAMALGDRPQQARHLNTYRGLVHQYRDFLGMVTAVRRDRGFDAARQLLISARGIEPAGEMQAVLGDIVTDARAIVDRRRNQRVAEAWAMQRLVLLSLFLAVVGGLVVTFQVRGEGRRRRESEAAVRVTLQEVDERVRERTSEFSLANAQLEEALAARADALASEQQARAAAEHANELKDRFLATVSHELRTPLNAIVGWIHVIKAGTLNLSETTHAIDAIERNARAQARLITDLLDVSRMIQGRLAFPRVPTDLRRAVGVAVDAARAAIDAKGLTLEYRRSPAEVRVLGDEGRLQQVTANLISNALKFTPRGGRIEVDLGTDGPFAQLRVRDTGEGIDPEVLPHLFDPFFQGHTRAMRAGLGLGLALVKELISLHGGTVTVESEGAGKGATATVRVPLTHAVRVPLGVGLSQPPQQPRRSLWRRLVRR